MTPDKKYERPQRGPRPFSAARLAAEAYFGASPEPAAPAPAVSPAPGPSASKSAGTSAAARQPKVHRLERPRDDGHDPGPPEPVAPLAEGAAPAPAPVESDSALVAAKKLRLPRRAPRQLHGDVVVIRPTPTDPPAGAVSSVHDDGAAHSPSPAHAASSGDGESRYPKLLAQLRALEIEVEAARRREAAEALRWIRREMEAYGITIEELGLP